MGQSVATTVATGAFQDELIANGLSAEVKLPPQAGLATAAPTGAPSIATDAPTKEPEVIIVVVEATQAPTEATTSDETFDATTGSTTAVPTSSSTTAEPTSEPTVFVDSCPKQSGNCEACLSISGCLWCVESSTCFYNFGDTNSFDGDVSKRFLQGCEGTVTGSKEICAVKPPTDAPTFPPTEAPTFPPTEVPTKTTIADPSIDALTTGTIEPKASEEGSASGLLRLANTILFGAVAMLSMLL